MSPVSLIRRMTISLPWGWSRDSVKRSGSPSVTVPDGRAIEIVCGPVAVARAETAAL